MKSLFFTLALLSAMVLNAQKVQTVSFWVGGVCDMCEQRIENALDVKGVKVADYSLENHKVTITYNTKKLNEAKLHELINKVGHDTSASKATYEAYDNVHGCCKYRDPEVQKAHQHGEGDHHDHDDDDHDDH